MQVCVPKCPSHFWMLSAAAYDPDANPKDFFHQQYCDHSLNLTTTTWVQGILHCYQCAYRDWNWVCGTISPKHSVKHSYITV